MPPRYAYWTILIDHKPTAFRARDREDLLPTLYQLRRKNADVVMKWFARGRLWESPAQAELERRAPRPAADKRSRDWRPGGKHRDPRDRRRPPGPTAAASRARDHRASPSKAAYGAPRGKTQSGRPPWHRNRVPESPNPKPRRRPESPDAPPAPEQIVIKPKPPERG